MSKITLNPKHVQRFFCKKEAWLKQRTDKKDSYCSICKVPYKDNTDTHVGLAIFFDAVPNKHLCTPCCETLIAQGGVDIDKVRADNANKKEALIAEIKGLGYVEGGWRKIPLKDQKIDELELLKTQLSIAKEKVDTLANLIVSTFVPTPTEQYLIDDYGVMEDEKYLQHESQFADYFSDFSELFSCGQGYYNDKITVISKIGNRFFLVNLEAEIDSKKQDVGDRLYWVESVSVKSYQEIEKPLPKTRKDYTLKLIDITEAQYNSIISHIKENKIGYE